MSDDFLKLLVIYLAVLFGLFLVCVYITRAIFCIPRFLRYQRAQIKLLEEIAKVQGVDNKKVQTIIKESIEWEPA
jgi:hypothetical protein